MKKTALATLFLSTAVLSAFSTTANADFYAIADLTMNQGSIDSLCDNLQEAAQSYLNMGYVSAVATCDDKDSGYSVGAGYRLFPWLSFEAGYHNLGESFYSMHASNGVSEEYVDVLNKNKAYSVSGVFSFPVMESLRLFGRLAINRWDAELIGKQFMGGELMDVTLSDSGTSLGYGIGAEYRMQQFGVTAEFRRVLDFGHADLPDNYEYDVDSFALGARYYF